MEIVKSGHFGLEVLDKDIIIDGDVAWNIAQLINDFESDVRLAKGKFWNRCKHGTREKICDHFDWSYNTMEVYSRYAREMRMDIRISFSHWDTLRLNGITKDERPAWLEKAADKEWTPQQLLKAVVKKQEKQSYKILEKSMEKDIKDGFVPKDTTLEDYQEKKNQALDDILSRERPVLRKTSTDMSVVEAFEIFGIHDADKFTWISKESLSILWRGLSKTTHGDTTKNGDSAMQTLNIAHEILKSGG